mgnify:CR=1 FL=1
MTDVSPSTAPLLRSAFRTDAGRDPDKTVNEDAAIYVEARLGLAAPVAAAAV